MNPKGKYTRSKKPKMRRREWPNKVITHAPIFCSVDERDGNQALAMPMNLEQKIKMFETLVDCGFKEIEVGFPASSPVEYEFVRYLIDGNHIPDDVIIQVLTPAREDLIEKTIESLVGVKRVIIHLYNSTSPAQRNFVFRLKKPEVIALAVQGVRWIKQSLPKLSGSEVKLQYSPESFSATEIDFSLEICAAVMKEWQPTAKNKMIINLPNTVEVAMPNVYADQVEYFCQHIPNRKSVIISVHSHNDRGTGIAATEMAMLAGAERVEGTLFGNGERTGNADTVTLALNLFVQGIDPGLDFSNLGHVRKVYESCTGMLVPPRQPYSGDMVFVAFSGTHQDAIRKALQVRRKKLENNKGGKVIPWNIPYLHIDPHDIGRHYREIILITSQSGKGGIGYVLENEFGLHLPKDLERDFSVGISKEISVLGRVVKPDELKTMFDKEYVGRNGAYIFTDYFSTNTKKGCEFGSVLTFGGEKKKLIGKGNGPINAFIHSLRKVVNVSVLDQSEHTLGEGSESSAIGYVLIQFSDGEKRWGAGVDTNIQLASIKAIVSALNRK
jgi:2-isopropylmalate synthase